MSPEAKTNNSVSDPNKEPRTAEEIEQALELAISEEKKLVRKTAYEIIEGLDPVDLERRSKEAVAQIRSLKEYKEASNVLLYHPIKGEPDLRSIIDDHSPDSFEKTYALPRALGQGVMVLFEIKDFSNLKSERYGVMVPPSTNELVKKEDLDLIIAPGLMFTAEGQRLGRGGGYYDRLLKLMRSQKESECKIIGVCFKELVAEHLPKSEHDQIFDHVLAI